MTIKNDIQTIYFNFHFIMFFFNFDCKVSQKNNTISTLSKVKKSFFSILINIVHNIDQRKFLKHKTLIKVIFIMFFFN